MTWGRKLQAFTSLVKDVRSDHAVVRHYHEKYRPTQPTDEKPLAQDAIEMIGLQLMVAYRVMRFFDATGSSLAPRVMSRLIRHAYGSDIHWNADLAPGVMVVHGMGMAISRSARMSPRTSVLFQHCTLGEGRHPDTGDVGAPVVEEGAVIGAGAVVVGPVTIGARSKIMPCCVIVRSVPPDSIVESPSGTVREKRPRAITNGPTSSDDTTSRSRRKS